VAQAFRRSAVAPRGLEHWLTCEAGDADASRLADGLIAMLGGQPADDAVSSDELVGGVLRLLAASSPVAVCVYLDDVHRIPDGSGGAALLAAVVDQLPSHVHLVAASRTPPPACANSAAFSSSVASNPIPP